MEFTVRIFPAGEMTLVKVWILVQQGEGRTVRFLESNSGDQWFASFRDADQAQRACDCIAEGLNSETVGLEFLKQLLLANG